MNGGDDKNWSSLGEAAPLARATFSHKLGTIELNKSSTEYALFNTSMAVMVMVEELKVWYIYCCKEQQVWNQLESQLEHDTKLGLLPQKLS